MPVLGIQVDYGSLDLIHRLNGDYVLVTDHKNEMVSPSIKSVRDYIENIANELINEGAVRYKYCHTISPRSHSSVKIISPIVTDFVPDVYCNDKILKAGDGLPTTAINEILVDGDGWVNYKDFLNDPSKYGDNGVLKVEQVNVAYVRSDKLVGVDGQMDLSIANFEAMAEKINKPYYISVSDQSCSRYDRSNFAVASFNNLSDAVKAWYEINEKTEYTPGVMDKEAGCCVFNGCDNNFEEITYERAAEMYGFDKIENIDKLITDATQTVAQTDKDEYSKPFVEKDFE